MMNNGEPISFNRFTRVVRQGNRRAPLAPHEGMLFGYLVALAGDPLPGESAQALLNPDGTSKDASRYLRVVVHRLRSKLAHARISIDIQNVRSTGAYVLSAPVEVVGAERIVLTPEAQSLVRRCIAACPDAALADLTRVAVFGNGAGQSAIDQLG
jgi:hypothetical protein